MPGRWGKIPFLLPVLCLGTGIALSNVPMQCSLPLLASGLLALILGGLVGLGRVRIACLLPISLVAVLLAGICLGLAGRDAVSSDDLRVLFAAQRIPLDRPLLLEGCITEELETRGDELLATVRLHGCRPGDQWLVCRGKLLLRIPLGESSGQPAPESLLSYGARIRVWAICSRPRNFLNPGYVDRVSHLAGRGIHFVGRVKSPRLVEVLSRDCGTVWKRAALNARERVRSLIRAPESRTQGSAVLISLVIGDHAGLEAGTREVFQNAGTYHVLVVSGLHVGWVTWLLLHGMSRLRVPVNTSRILVAFAILSYSAIVGFQASVSRCLWLYALYFCAQSLFRTTNPVNLALAAAFFLLTANPRWLFHIGFQLSFCSVLSILWLGLHFVNSGLRPLLEPLTLAGSIDRLTFGRGALNARGRRWRASVEVLVECWTDRRSPRAEAMLLGLVRKAARVALHIAGMLLVTISVQVSLGLLLALYFNRVSWIAPLANLFAVPLAAVALAVGAAALCLDGVGLPDTGMMNLALGCSELLLDVTSRVADWAGAWQRCPTPPASVVVLLLVVPALWHLLQWRRVWIPCAASLLYLAWLANGTGLFADLRPLAEIPGARQPDRLEMTFLDVGQGDSIVIRFPDRTLWVLDAGGMRASGDEEAGSPSFDPGESVVSRFLWSHGMRKVDRILLSHPHLDHAGGIPALMKNFRVGGFHFGEWRPDQMRARLLALAAREGASTSDWTAGTELNAGGVLVQVLNPPADHAYRSVNDGSLVLRLTYGRFSSLLAGDLEKAGEIDLIRRRSDLDALLLKVAHHGSRSATLDPFLKLARPRWAVISVGRNNPFAHPAGEVIHRLLRHGVRPLHTSDQGAITLKTDGIRYTLSSFAGGLLEQGTLPERER